MKKEQTFLLSLLSSAFEPTATIPAPELSPAEWKHLIVESFCQAVGYLTFSLCEPFKDRVPADLCAGVMEDIFALGNFGMKDRGRSHGAALTGGETPARKKSVFGVFHGMVMGKHPVLHRAPILYPLFAVGEFFGYCFGALCGKRTRPSKLLRSARERKTLYDRLAIFQTGNTRSVPPTDSIS